MRNLPDVDLTGFRVVRQRSSNRLFGTGLTTGDASLRLQVIDDV
jgi:hypothetical protein